MNCEVSDVFFLLSGEHPTLPWAELRAVLEAESCVYFVKESLGQVVRLSVDEGALAKVAARCGMTRVGCAEIAFTKSSHGEIVETLRRVDFSHFLEAGTGIAVRVIRVGKVPSSAVEPLEREVGKLVVSGMPGLRVDLKGPQVVLVGVLSPYFFILGASKGPLLKKPFFQRRPRKRPFFHATAMSVKLSRCMVNLARPRRGTLVLDPFCGTGSIMVEAGLMGFRVAGGDVQERMVKGCSTNLRHFGLDPGLILHDARKTPFRKADCIVGDPPYGRAATTLSLDARDILRAFFNESRSILAKDGYICLAFPQALDIKELGVGAGLFLVESHLLYVHKSLTREIAVFRKDN